jgi:hypothetical protein
MLLNTLKLLKYSSKCVYTTLYSSNKLTSTIAIKNDVLYYNSNDLETIYKILKTNARINIKSIKLKNK